MLKYFLPRNIQQLISVIYLLKTIIIIIIIVIINLF